MIITLKDQDWIFILNNIHIQRIAEIIRRQFNLWVIFVSDGYIQWIGTQQNVDILQCLQCHASSQCRQNYFQWFEQFKCSQSEPLTCYQNFNGMGCPIFYKDTLVAALFVSGLSSESLTDREKCILHELMVEISSNIQFELIHQMELTFSNTQCFTKHKFLHDYSHIIGKSEAMLKLFSLLDQISDASSHLYLEGKPGVGKKLVAKTIHTHSPRKQGPFIVINCALFNEEQLEAELFGQTRGAYPGAFMDKPGLLDIADRGTFYLENLDSLSPKLQFRLLKFLREGSFIPVGDTVPHTADIRIIASADDTIYQKIDSGLFSEELFETLRIICIQVPPLSERTEDIPLLVDHFLKIKCQKNHKDIKLISLEALDILTHYSWPGNIRELENEIERMVVLSPDEAPISADIISQRILKATLAITDENQENHQLHDFVNFTIDGNIGTNLQNMMDDIERKMITRALIQNKGNRSKTAEILGMSRRNLIRKIEKLGIQE